MQFWELKSRNLGLFISLVLAVSFYKVLEGISRLRVHLICFRLQVGKDTWFPTWNYQSSKAAKLTFWPFDILLVQMYLKNQNNLWCCNWFEVWKSRKSGFVDEVMMEENLIWPWTSPRPFSPSWDAFGSDDSKRGEKLLF